MSPDLLDTSFRYTIKACPPFVHILMDEFLYLTKQSRFSPVRLSSLRASLKRKPPPLPTFFGLSCSRLIRLLRSSFWMIQKRIWRTIDRCR